MEPGLETRGSGVRCFCGWSTRPILSLSAAQSLFGLLTCTDNPVHSQKRFSRDLVVLYEDAAVVAIDKPAGLAAVPVKGSDAPSALSLLSARLKLKRQRALVVHRIDRFTSGILLFAKTGQDRDALVRQFLSHTPVRQYLAVIRGRLEAREGSLVHYFRRD